MLTFFNVAHTRTRILIRYGHEHEDTYNIKSVDYIMWTSMFYIIFWSRKMFFMTGSKRFLSYFCNHNKNLCSKFEFLEN